MDRSNEGTKVDWMSVPAFGDWDNHKGGTPDYSLDFSKLRQMRKQNKSDYARVSIGNEQDLIQPSRKDPSTAAAPSVSLSATPVTPAIHHRNSPSGRKRVMSYFVCCIGA